MFTGPAEMIYKLLIWMGACVSWVLVSAFLHELGHLAAARLAGFRVRDYRLVSGRGGVRGYVDVLIHRGARSYYVKKGLMHIAGVVVNVVLAVCCLLLFRLPAGSALKLVWLLGFGVNCYLILLNTVPSHSDGRQFWLTVKGHKAHKGKTK